MPDWDDYQENTAEFFRSLGLSAKTNESLEGARTRHNVDVVVQGKHAGFDVLWIIECKLWQTAIPKEKVLALRTIVGDIGADRGFIMAESGYQPGALEAAGLTNITLTSISDLHELLSHELGEVKLRSILDRVDACRERYWSIAKSDRIDTGLRPDSGGGGYSGDTVIRAVEYTARQALRHGFPVRYDRLTAAISATFPTGRSSSTGDDDEGTIGTSLELYDILDAELDELEKKLDAAEEGRRGSPRHGAGQGIGPAELLVAGLNRDRIAEFDSPNT